MQLKAFKSTLQLLIFLFLGLFVTTNSALAQEKSAFNAGIAVAISSTPEESDLEKAGQATEIYMDYEEVRFGLNSAAAKKNFSLYKNTWNTFLTTDAYFVAWRPEIGDSQDGGTYALIGLGYFLSSLDLGNGVQAQSTQSFGLVSGVGANAKIGEIVFGVQANYMTAQSKFHDIEVATGSTQLMFTMHLEI